jgi:hypothetical protein
MAEYERRMTQYILRDGELVVVPPKLADGEKEIIAEFHDECCFHVFDFLNSVWCIGEYNFKIFSEKISGLALASSSFGRSPVAA